jgi:uncharacterized protein
MLVEKLLKEKRAQILELATKYGAYNIRIFGSVARGEARYDSDVDFLIQLEAGRTLLDFVGFCQDLEDLLGRKVDVVIDRSLDPILAKAILLEAIPL